MDDPVDNGGSGDSQYSGFRDLTDDQIRTLASKVVEQVKKRGPFLTLAQFVNRRPDTNKDLSLSGALQAAIDETGLNDKLKALGRPGVSPPPNGSFSNVDAARLNTSAGAPGWLMQGDILDPLGPFITVRGDTFRIRSYGQATDKQGKVLAKAWCEAVVQRTPEYIDKTENAQTRQPVSPANLDFGREFRMISFRWLNNPDI